MNNLWMNGEYLPLEQGRIPVEDRSFQFADGIYEVIAAYDGVPVLMEEHLDRWEASAQGLHMTQIYDRQTRRAVINELVGELGAERTMIYGQLSRGLAKRAHPFPAEEQPLEIWYVRELKPYPREWYTQGVSILSHPDERWTRCWIKSTCLLPNCLAKQHAVENGCLDVLLFQEDGTVTESSAANAYVIKGGAIWTHPANGRILNGIKRQLVLEMARRAGIEVIEEKFNLEFARKADELFLTSTTINVLPATKLDGKPVGNGQIGALTTRLMDLVNGAVDEMVRRGQENEQAAS